MGKVATVELLISNLAQSFRQIQMNGRFLNHELNEVNLVTRLAAEMIKIDKLDDICGNTVSNQWINF